MKFSGKFINNQGKQVEWWFDATSEEALRKHLDEIGWQVSEMKLEKEKFTGKFKNEKNEIVNWDFEAPNEEALYSHLKEIGWEIIDLKSGEVEIFRNGINAFNRFKSAHFITRLLLYILIGGICLDIIGIISGLFQVGLINKVSTGIQISDSEANFNDIRQAIIGSFQFALQISIVIVFLIWLYRVYQNLPSFNVRGLKRSPGWVIGSFFIPIINLFTPYESVVEVWKASSPKSYLNGALAWINTKSSNIIIFWWIIWLTSNIGGRALFKYSQQKDVSIADLLYLSWGFVLADLLSILASLFLILIILEIDKRQGQSRELAIQYANNMKLD